MASQADKEQNSMLNQSHMVKMDGERLGSITNESASLREDGALLGSVEQNTLQQSNSLSNDRNNQSNNYSAQSLMEAL